QGGVTLFAAVERSAAQGDALVDGAPVAPLRRLADHHAHAVVDEHAAPDPGAGVDLDAGKPATEVGGEAPEAAQAIQPEQARELVDVDRMEPRIAGEHFPCAPRRRVAVEDAGDIGTELGEHESHL